MDQDELNALSRIFGFIAVYRFWRTLEESQPEDLRAAGREYLQQVAEMIAEELEGKPLSAYEAEALAWCGVSLRKEWLQ